MSPTSTNNNRPQRKQLSDQIDRLDTILDGLSDGLNQAVADAAREGTRLALKDALVEILTDPELRAKLQQATAPEAPPAPARLGFFAQIKAAACAVVRGAVSGTVALASVAVDTAKAAINSTRAVVTQTLRQSGRALQMIGNLKQLLQIGAGAGLAIALISFFAPHIVSAGLSGVSGAVAAMAVRAILWTRRTVRVLSFA